MKSVQAIIKDVYGDDFAAADKLKVGRTAVCNWKTTGRFPSRLLVRIFNDAKQAGLNLDIGEIPSAASAEEGEAA